ncbi:unnamed protein product [Symbiodinium sp. KB8]|nr:unnamed protein product [Symbiodinium sp. KB8]
MSAKAMELTSQLADMLKRFQHSELWEQWNTQQSLTSFVDECSHLSLLVQTACEPETQLTSETADGLKTARQSLLNKKPKAVFLESLTLFPLGQFVQQSCNEILETHYRDLGFVSDLEACVQACSELKTYSSDMVVKGDAMDIHVPQMQKVVEVLQKWNMIELAASKHFKEAHASKLSLLDAKFDELAGALKVACSSKFRMLVSESLQPLLEKLTQGQMSMLEGSPALLEAVNKAKLWVPCNMSLLQKCLGSKSKPLVSSITHVREFLCKMAKVCPSIVAIIHVAQTGEGMNQCGSSRLLLPDLVQFMKAFRDEEVQSGLSSLDNAWWLAICACMDTLCKGAMRIIASETSGFRKFIQFLASDEGGTESCADIVGEFHDDESDSMIDFVSVYQLYGSHIEQGWPAMEIDVATEGGAVSKLSVNSAAMCAAGALLPVAKMIVHTGGWLKTLNGMPASHQAFDKEMANPAQRFEGSIMKYLASREDEPGKLALCLVAASAAVACTNDEKARLFVRGCSAQIPKLLAKLVQKAANDFEATRGFLEKAFDAIVQRKDFQQAVENDKIEFDMSQQVCSDKSMQHCYTFLSFGFDHMQGMLKFVLAIAAAAGRCEFKDDEALRAVLADANVLIKTMKDFMNGGSSCTEGGVTVPIMASLVGDATVAQALVRPLKTRQGLVNKASTGVRKRGWKIHVHLTSRISAVLTGKPAAK